MADFSFTPAATPTHRLADVDQRIFMSSAEHRAVMAVFASSDAGLESPRCECEHGQDVIGNNETLSPKSAEQIRSVKTPTLVGVGQSV